MEFFTDNLIILRLDSPVNGAVFPLSQRLASTLLLAYHINFARDQPLAGMLPDEVVNDTVWRCTIEILELDADTFPEIQRHTGGN